MDSKASVSEVDILYHYTSLETFYAIAENKEVWASDIKYMNDATEFQYGLELAEEVFRDLSSKGSIAVSVEDDDDSVKSEIEGFLKYVLREGFSNLQAYIFSLTRRGDLLS